MFRRSIRIKPHQQVPEYETSEFDGDEQGNQRKMILIFNLACLSVTSFLRG